MADSWSTSPKCCFKLLKVVDVKMYKLFFELKDYVQQLFFPPLDSILHSIPECSYASDVASHLCKNTRIRKAHVEEYEAPEHFPLWFRRQYAFSERYVYQLSDCFVYMASGVVRIRKLWLQESVGHYRNILINVARLRLKSVACLFCRRGTIFESQFSTYLNVPGYYHFLLEALPCFLQVKSLYPQVHVIVKDSSQFEGINVFLEMLKELGQIQSLTRTNAKAVHCARYVFAGMEEKSGFVCRADVDLLRNTFLPLLVRTDRTHTRKIFISRRHASRRFDNQEEIENAVQSAGLEIVDLEGMEIQAQMLLFTQAELIVANHGAGLANLVWGSSDARVVELFSPRFLNDCYFRLAKTMAMSYDYIIAEDIGTWGKIDVVDLMRKIDDRSSVKEYMA